MKKRSVSVMGHTTSVTLEDEFWAALKQIAIEKKLSINGLIAAIDKNRGENLSSAIRLYVLAHFQEKLLGR